MDKFIEFLKKSKNFVKKYGYIILLGIIIVLAAIMMTMCSSNGNLKDEIKKQKNNELALRDTLTVYVDKLGRTNAEKHVYQLTQKELNDSIDHIIQKNHEYVSYLKTQLGIVDTFEVMCYIDRPYRDTSKFDSGVIVFDTSDTFGKSGRHISVSIPYDIDTTLNLYNGTFELEQNIFFEGWLERNTKTGETFVHLRSDYPGLMFNTGEGFVAEPSVSYERSMRKQFGLGVFIGPSVGFGYTPQKWQPYVGLSIGFGLTFTPRVLQW